MIRMSCVLLALTLGVVTPGAAQETVAQEQAASQQSTAAARTGVVVGKSAKKMTLWTRNGREVFTITEATTMPQRKVREGNLVVLRETESGSKIAAQIVLVDEQVFVTGKGSKGERALIGTTWPSQSPSHVVVRTATGEEMFVIDPRTFRQPLPEKNQRVAVTYRVESLRPPRFKATGIYPLGEAIAKSPVEIIYEDIPQPEAVVAEVAPTPIRAPERGPEPITELPQTASREPLVLLAALVSLLSGVGLLRRRPIAR